MTIVNWLHHVASSYPCRLVVLTPLKNISQLGWLFPIYGKFGNVPNHQPALKQKNWALQRQEPLDSRHIHPYVIYLLYQTTAVRVHNKSCPQCFHVVRVWLDLISGLFLMHFPFLETLFLSHPSWSLFLDTNSCLGRIPRFFKSNLPFRGEIPSEPWVSKLFLLTALAASPFCLRLQTFRRLEQLILHDITVLHLGCKWWIWPQHTSATDSCFCVR